MRSRSYSSRPRARPARLGDRPGDADLGARVAADLVGDALREQRAHRCRRIVELCHRRWIGGEEPLRDANRADVEALVPANAVGTAGDELGRAATDVDDHRSAVEPSFGRDAAEHQHRLVVPGQEASREAVAPLDLAEKRLAVFGIAHCARRDPQRPFRPERLGGSAKVREHVTHARDRHGQEATALVDTLAEARDPRLARDVRDLPVALRPPPAGAWNWCPNRPLRHDSWDTTVSPCPWVESPGWTEPAVCSTSSIRSSRSAW